MTDNRTGYDTTGLSFAQDEYRQERGLAPQTHTVTELIEVLEQIKSEHGDLPVENHYIGLKIAPRVSRGVVEL